MSQKSMTKRYQNDFCKANTRKNRYQRWSTYIRRGGAKPSNNTAHNRASKTHGHMAEMANCLWSDDCIGQMWDYFVSTVSLMPHMNEECNDNPTHSLETAVTRQRQHLKANRQMSNSAFLSTNHTVLENKHRTLCTEYSDLHTNYVYIHIYVYMTRELQYAWFTVDTASTRLHHGYLHHIHTDLACNIGGYQRWQSFAYTSKGIHVYINTVTDNSNHAISKNLQ